MAPMTDTARRARNVARAATVARAGAASPTAGLLDHALQGGRLARGQAGSGESDALRGGGPLDPDSTVGRYLRRTGWVVARDHVAAIAPDQVRERLASAGLIAHGASVDDAVEEYAKLARLACDETSGAALRRDHDAEAAWFADREAQEAERDLIARILADWLARLVHGPKFEYAAALVAWWTDGGPEPSTPATSWGPKCRHRFDYLTRDRGTT